MTDIPSMSKAYGGIYSTIKLAHSQNVSAHKSHQINSRIGKILTQLYTHAQSFPTLKLVTTFPVSLLPFPSLIPRGNLISIAIYNR